MDEPRRHRTYLFLVSLCALGSVPFAFIGRAPAVLLDVPLWLWSSVGFTVGLSAVTVWGIRRLWRDDRFE